MTEFTLNHLQTTLENRFANVKQPKRVENELINKYYKGVETVHEMEFKGVASVLNLEIIVGYSIETNEKQRFAHIKETGCTYKF